MNEVYISTPFCVIPGIETSSKYLLIEYWNDEKIAYPDGFITTGANNDFRYQMYVPATICKPKYEFEEELTKRAGYKFLELQTSTKVYAFTFVAPEFICDAMRLIRLSDYIRISHDGEYYNALNFEFDVDWQEQLYLAAVDCQFETDSIIQKLPSFNRRDKASFYNALLANIDTPIMFSPDTVGLYYKEYRGTEPVIKGKLIRELSPIDLIDENTTIAVDMGAGEARKFNLYRMLEGYISKNHEDVTEFLLSLRGGVNIGTPNVSGEYPASVDRYGNAKLKDIQGNDATLNNVTGKGATFKTVETGFLTVNKTSATIDGMGNANVNDLTARGDSMLRSDVYTGSKKGNSTGKITKEGQLQYLSAIIYEFLSSETFVPGFLGEGFKIWLENGNWHIECDNLTVRQTMNIFELLIQKIRSVNGAIVVSQSNGKLSAVEEVGTQYKLTTGEEFPTFQEGDLVRCQTFAGYQGAGLTFDFTQFAKYDYSGSAFDSSLIDVTPDSISFNLNNTGNSGFAFYKFSESSPTPIEIPSFTLTLEGGYPGMMAIATGLDSSDSPVESAGVLLQNGDNVIPAIKAAQGIHNFAIIITGDSGHGNGKVTVKQKKAAGSAPNNSLVKFYWVEVKSVEGTSFFADKAEFNGVVPTVGDEVVQMGNTKNPERQALIYITAQESGKPYIEILNGVKTKSLTGTDRTRLGDLSNIVDPDFTGEAAVKGTGFYSTNAFLKGIFVLRNGKRVEDEIKIAKDAADQAAQDAANAAQSAQEAKDRLNKWADDGLISPTEKPALIDEGKRIQAEYLQIKANADKYGVSVTEYTEAYNNYLNELRYHSATTPENIVVRPELAQSQTAYYDKRNGALNAIATASKEYVDNADKKLKEYLDTEITAIPGKIELAVRSLKTANYNLLLDSNHTLSANPYQLGAYKYDVHLVKGKSYTLTVCYKCADSDDVVAYNNPSFGYLAILPKSAEETIVSTKITPSQDDAAYFYFYKTPQKETTQTYVRWAVITDGDMGVAQWIPSKSEILTGGRNLVLNSGVCVSQYSLFGLSQTYYELRGQKVVISFDYEYSNLVLGGNNRFGVETEIPLSGGGVQLFGAFVYLDSRSLTNGKGRFYYATKVSDNVVDNGLKHIQAHVQVGTGTVVKMCNFQIEKGDVPSDWSPAPEDIYNDSVKYTDTQISAVDGKIELSVTTELNKRVIGGANLCLKSGVCITGVENHLRINMSKYWRDLRGKKVTLSFDYEYSNLVLGRNSRIGLEEGVLKDGTSNYYYIGAWKYFDSTSLKAGTGRFVHTITVPNDIVNAQNIGIGFYIQVGDGTTMKICNPQIEIGDTATEWKPAPEDGIIESKEYTNSQISVVEGKITSTVEKINTVDGRVTGLASRVEQTEKSITSVVGDIGVINSTTNRHVSKRIDLRGWDNNKFFPLVISIPVYHKTRVEISRPLDAGYGKPSYGTHDGGFSMNLTFEMSGSGWGSLPAVTNIFDYTKAWISAGAKIVVDLGQITETSTCRMGIRGGSMYDVTVDDTIDPNVINVYQTDYHGSYNTSFPVRTDGTEPVRTYGYYTEIKQTQESIALTANKVDDQGRRLSAAELTLSSDHAKLSVVEQTANSANSLAGTANGKAEAADGRVTATQNGLVETGINITSRKIVLKSDNVLFQNNAGQQTAAINANGKLTANAIEVGEVVANGFAAQRITTGNLTVTDGAVIAGMAISGGVLTGKNIHITDGAKIGNFTIESGILSANGMVAGMQMRLSNNLMELSSSGLRVDQNSGGYAVNVRGNGRCYMQGVESYRKFNVYEFAGATQWKAPGVHYAAVVFSSTGIGQRWGNPSITPSATKLSTGRYRVTISGVSSNGFIPMVTACNSSKWVNACIEEYSFTSNYFTVKFMDVNTGMIDTDFVFYICGWV
ncbi:tail fiber protein [Bacteroides phage B40-8]|uniref:tail fiber protein n=2 Tax=root TaxID=1 RepID=UPI00017FB64C|nr:tail fiber protein [Bacteroides phage B40-8]ACH81942.1 putative tail fiber protein [Bacteroides phage B40-8]